jgi:peptidoglycan/LPS O-acetylase OafA/YrhL
MEWERLLHHPNCNAVFCRDSLGLMAKQTLPPSGRIPYLDGLRACSILAVVLDHVDLVLRQTGHFLPLLTSPAGDALRIVFGNGRLGVRVFFVLSGFLITTLLLNELESTGQISIRGFYERRIARIFPAFYIYFAIVIVLILVHLTSVSWPVLATAGTYLWNYGILWKIQSTEGAQFFGHMWTLSLEEQFYLIWPACLIYLGPRRAERLAVASVVVLPFVRVISYFIFPSTRGQLGMMFHTSADQILWGTLAAFACRRGAIDRVGKLRYRAAIPWIYGLMVFVLCPLLTRAVRGLEVFLIPTLEGISIVLLIFWLLSGSSGPLRRGLETWPMVQLGLLSYSLYLWQQMFIFWDGLAWVSLPLRMLATFVVAIASYRLVEIPCRKYIRQWFSQSQPAH